MAPNIGPRSQMRSAATARATARLTNWMVFLMATSALSGRGWSSKPGSATSTGEDRPAKEPAPRWPQWRTRNEPRP
eukprot:1413303-Lingulodinium_polyedra.AAC.1